MISRSISSSRNNTLDLPSELGAAGPGNLIHNKLAIYWQSSNDFIDFILHKNTRVFLGRFPIHVGETCSAAFALNEYLCIPVVALLHHVEVLVYYSLQI